MDEKFYWYWLLNIENISSTEISRAIGIYETPQNIFEGGHIGVLSEERNEALKLARREADKYKASYDSLEANGIQMVLRDDEIYPKKLVGIPDEPYGFFLRGKLPDFSKPSVAMVGARRATHHGKYMAEHLAYDLAMEGVTVISGMAEGIDGSSHIGALDGGGSTLAVLGSGIDVCYPPLHKALYERLIDCGGIISEYGPGAPGLSFHFPLRNRIISALSDIVIVVEAREKSGSLITVSTALTQGRDVMAIPGRPDDPGSVSCNRLIKEGAGCCTCAADVIKQLMTVSSSYNLTRKNTDQENKKGKAGSFVQSDVQEMLILSVLSGAPKHIEDISKETALDITLVTIKLMEMEIKGSVMKVTSGTYRKN